MTRSDTPEILIRHGAASDLPFLKEMLCEAINWRGDMPQTHHTQIRQGAEFQKLLADWGTRSGDTAVIAECDRRAVGAAWYRYWTRNHHSYGFVDPSYPETAMGVLREHRRKGVGRALIEALIARACSDRIPGLSLSVDPENVALRLYESVGFARVGTSGTSLILLREL